MVTDYLIVGLGIPPGKETVTEKEEKFHGNSEQVSCWWPRGLRGMAESFAQEREETPRSEGDVSRGSKVAFRGEDAPGWYVS